MCNEKKDNHVLYNQRVIERKDDMSVGDSLIVAIDEGGDIHLSINADGGMTEIEFCTSGMGGGGSPKTHNALRQLFIAMYKDQLDQSNGGRACGRYPAIVIEDNNEW